MSEQELVEQLKMNIENANSLITALSEKKISVEININEYASLKQHLSIPVINLRVYKEL